MHLADITEEGVTFQVVTALSYASNTKLCSSVQIEPLVEHHDLTKLVYIKKLVDSLYLCLQNLVSNDDEQSKMCHIHLENCFFPPSDAKIRRENGTFGPSVMALWGIRRDGIMANAVNSPCVVWLLGASTTITKEKRKIKGKMSFLGRGDVKGVGKSSDHKKYNVY